MSNRLWQPRNTHEWIVSALFEKVAPVALVPHLNYQHGKWWTFDFKMLVSITGSVLQILVLSCQFNNTFLHLYIIIHLLKSLLYCKDSQPSSLNMETASTRTIASYNSSCSGLEKIFSKSDLSIWTWISAIVHLVLP